MAQVYRKPKAANFSTFSQQAELFLLIQMMKQPQEAHWYVHVHEYVSDMACCMRNNRPERHLREHHEERTMNWKPLPRPHSVPAKSAQ